MYYCFYYIKTVTCSTHNKTYVRGDFFLPQESLTLAEAEQYIPTAPYIPIGVRSCSTVRGQSDFSVEETYCRTAAKHLHVGQRQELTPCDALALTSKIPADFCINKVKRRRKGCFSCMRVFVRGWDVGVTCLQMSSMQNKNVNTRSKRDGGRHTFL